VSRPDVDINDSIAYRIYVTNRLLRRSFLAMAERWGIELSPEQWFVLNRLAWNDGRAQGELGEAIFADRPNLSRLIAGLQKKGLLRRQPDPDDGRRMLVYLTAEGRRVHDAFAAGVDGVRAELFAGIEPDELRAAMAVVDRIRDNVVAALE
jgi:DNA-binding MarR family transcriptional regulator